MSLTVDKTDIENYRKEAYMKLKEVFTIKHSTTLQRFNCLKKGIERYLDHAEAIVEITSYTDSVGKTVVAKDYDHRQYFS